MRSGLGPPFPHDGEEAGGGGGAPFDRLLRNDPSPIAVALSGGSDSVALLRSTCAWARRAARPVLAFTVDHGLNPQSAAWTQFAGEAAARAGAGFRTLVWDGPKPASGLPAAARAARHALLATAARQAGVAVVLLGHTADDVDETERMRAGDAPGIGRLREWSPSPAWPEGEGVFLLRPMLNLRRADLRAWLLASGETWIDDPANLDPRYARVRARLAGGDPPILAKCSRDEAVGRLAGLARPLAGGGIALPQEPLLEADPAVARRVLSAAVICVGGGARPPRSGALDRLLAAVGAGAPPSTLAGARIAAGQEVIVRREPGEARRRLRTHPRDFGPREGASGYARFRAATFQIADEAALRTTCSP